MIKYAVVLIATIICSAWPSSAVYAQYKYERETRISADDVPDSAKIYCERIDDRARWRWYREQEKETVSLEAKAKVRGRRYSVEFYMSGTLQDVEIDVDFKQLPDSLQARICDVLTQDFGRDVKIKKVQDQLTGDLDRIIAYTNGDLTVDVIHNYEIIVEGKEEGTAQRYEYTFDGVGMFVSRYKLVLRNMDNLEF